MKLSANSIADVLLFSLVLIAINFEMSLRLISVDYKVFGRVQGVFFRKFTKNKAKELGLRGYVQNDRDGTVIGTIQGTREPIDTMKNWLTSTGSPYSSIDRCEFSREKLINEYEYNAFEVRH